MQTMGLVGDPRIGRNPFGPRDADAPWHGGDAAWPGHPGYWNGAPWVSDFMPRGGARAGAIEDLRERLADQAAGVQASRPHALPSSFGPWGLMRAAGATGGRYVLWSWNPHGRSDVTYDWTRCDLFAPDLRARETIRADLVRRPIAQAIVRAWDVAADPKYGVASVSSPLSPRFAAQEMHRIAGGEGMRTSWGTRDQHRAFLRAAPEVLARMDDAIEVLGRAVRDADRRLDDPDRRLLADAHLFRHVLLAERHSIGEALEEAKTVPDAWFDEKEMWVGLQPTLWVEAGADPERIDARFDLLRDRARGQAAVDDRAAMLRRYAATPFGETVARNQMYVWRAKLFPRGTGSSDATRSPAESTPTPPIPTPGGSGGAPGPSTGK
ncbi:MAG: hypothetical protein K8T90_15940 [Planctomycetes bacterium]|nr:hypothetical protein [Planctomycetota bacterium]